jgi:putative ABC transport system permease protein
MANSRDDDLDREIRTHLELEAEERIADGLPEAAARHAARRAFGNVTRTHEDVRAVWTRVWLQDLRSDVVYAMRTLIRNRGFAAVAILTLALGIGATVAIFGLVDAVMLRPLPFREPDRLVVLWEDFAAVNGPATVEPSPADYRDWQEQNRVFDGLAAIQGRMTLNLTGAGDPEPLSAARVTGNLFPILGLSPILGRTIGIDDDRAGASPVAVISEGLWRRRFGADRTLVDRSIMLDGVPHTVIGVVPGDFQFPAKGTEVWVPAAFTPEQLSARMTFYLYVVGRLKPGVSLAQARADMSTLSARLRRALPGGLARVGITLVPLHEQYVRTARPLYTLLVATVGILLLIACVNVAHLLLARGTERHKELALRGALGASRGRVLRQLLTESVLLAFVGAIAGAALASVASGFLVRLVPENFPDRTVLGSDASLLAFTVTVAALTSIVFGVGPAWRASRPGLHDALKGWTARGASSRERRLRGALVVAEVSMSVVLLVAAGLLLRSFVALSSVDIGFSPQGLVVAETPLSPATYGSSSRRLDLVTRVVERVRSLPGIVSAGYVNYPPLTFPGGRSAFFLEGRPEPPPEEMSRQMAVNRAVSAGYLPALGVPLRHGRHFDDRDRAGATPAVIINETMARRFWGNADPTGRRIRFGAVSAEGAWLTIVGVVGDVRQIGLDLGPEPELYVPFDQLAATAPPFAWPRYLVVRTTGDPTRIAPAIRAAVMGVDADQPVARVRTMEDVIDDHLSSRSTQLTLIAAFSVLALVLASVGLYGVLAHAVARQTPEIGLRIALGATRVDVIGPLIRRTMALTGMGVLLGLAAAGAVTRVFSSLLYAVSPTDLVAFTMVPLLLIGVAAVACWAPARRATKVDPLAALRTE